MVNNEMFKYVSYDDDNDNNIWMNSLIAWAM